jgi:uncharacterized protein YciI
MPLFVAIALDKNSGSAELREQLRKAHRRYVVDHTAPIRFAGPTLAADGKQTGSIYLFELETAEAVRAWFAAEPFHAGGVYGSLEVRPFYVAYNDLDQVAWPVLPPG